MNTKQRFETTGWQFNFLQMRLILSFNWAQQMNGGSGLAGICKVSIFESVERYYKLHRGVNLVN